LKEHLPIEVIHADDFIMDVGDLSEKRAAVFRELRSDKKNPPREAGELIQRFNGHAIGDLCKHLVAKAKLNTEDVIALI
jgi:hypothetical protein